MLFLLSLPSSHSKKVQNKYMRNGNNQNRYELMNWALERTWCAPILLKEEWEKYNRLFCLNFSCEMNQASGVAGVKNIFKAIPIPKPNGISENIIGNQMNVNRIQTTSKTATTSFLLRKKKFILIHLLNEQVFKNYLHKLCCQARLNTSIDLEFGSNKMRNSAFKWFISKAFRLAFDSVCLYLPASIHLSLNAKYKAFIISLFLFVHNT